MKEKHFVCVECPRGCSLTVTLSGEEIKSIKGNDCPRGKTYAESEAICPRRVLTTTVRAEDGRMVPVKTSAPIKKEDTFPVLEKIKTLRVSCPKRIGEVVCPAIVEDIDLVVTKNMK